MLLLFFTMFLAAGYIIGSLAYANAYYAQKHAGFIAGLGAGSWSLMVALVMPAMGPRGKRRTMPHRPAVDCCQSNGRYSP